MEGEALRRHLGLVFIHGAGKEPSGYYRGFLEGLLRQLGAEPAILPAWWGDLCNLGSEVKGGPGAVSLSKEAEDFRRAYLRELGVGVRGDREGAGGGLVRSVGGTLVSLADTANDVVQYFFNPRLRAAVQARLVEQLARARDGFDQCILVSHSLGTVIAYDVLRQRGTEFNLHTWFTTGSPLARLARLGRVTTDLGEITSGALFAWQNVYDATDVVASPLAPMFGFPLKDIQVDNGQGIMNSHNYWGNAAVAGLVAEEVKKRYLRIPLQS
jgi:hypothetical protein